MTPAWNGPLRKAATAPAAKTVTVKNAHRLVRAKYVGTPTDAGRPVVRAAALACHHGRLAKSLVDGRPASHKHLFGARRSGFSENFIVRGVLLNTLVKTPGNTPVDAPLDAHSLVNAVESTLMHTIADARGKAAK